MLVALLFVFFAIQTEDFALLFRTQKKSLQDLVDVSYTVRSMAETLRGSECASVRNGYHKITCPEWPNKKDPMMDYIDQRQNPTNCMKQNYFLGLFNTGIGFGASIRGTVLGSFFAALYSGRVMIIHPSKFHFSGCANDDTWTCYFLPVSNCTYKEHVEAVIKSTGSYLKDGDSNRLQRYNTSLRVLESDATWAPYQNFERPNIPLKEAYEISHDRVAASTLKYLLRLKEPVKDKIESILKDSLPCDFDPSRTISLPIRGSDKCESWGILWETRCLSFDLYMEFAERLRDLDPKLDTIILTSEDPQYLQNRTLYENRWRFVLNTYDVSPGVGNPGSVFQKNFTKDEIFLSFMSTLHLQMRGKYLVLNCASNYQMILRHLVEYGDCGVYRSPIVICMDDQYGKFNLCHSFSNQEQCKQKQAIEVKRRLQSAISRSKMIESTSRYRHS